MTIAQSNCLWIVVVVVQLALLVAVVRYGK